jgi:hypothetical protein
MMIFFGDDVKTEMHVLVVWHGGVEVEIGKSDAQKLSPWDADGGVDEEFGHGEISCWRAFILVWIVDAIAADSELNVMHFFFLWSIIAAYTAVGGAFVSWNVQFEDEKTCVSAGDVSDALEESPKFVGKTVCPNVLVFVQFHQVLIFEDIVYIVVDDGIDEVNGGVKG